MDSNLLLTAIASVLGAALLCAALWRQASAKQAQLIDDLRSTTQTLERQLHLKERDFLAERNQFEISHLENIRAARAAAYEEGRQLGLTEGNAAHIGELSAQRLSLVTKFEAEREQALTEARNKVRAEYELQAKLFSVKISPYVSVREDKGLLRCSYETTVGYQYQLLVSGIPAFSPHVIVEQTKIKKEFSPEVERLLVQTAEHAAVAAINHYFGGSAQCVKLTEPIIRRLPKR